MQNAIDGGITAPKGFVAAGVHCGIKKVKKDLSLVVSESMATAAGVFTQGDLIMKARRLLMSSLAKPGFLDSYLAQLKQERRTEVDRDSALGELAGQLEGIGIAPEDALRALAA